MKKCTILLTAMAVGAMMGGCERSTANEQYEPFDKGTDAMTTDVGAGYVSGDLLADQVRVASAEKKRRQPAEVAPKVPTNTHIKDTGLKPDGAGTGTGAGTDTGTGTGTGTGTDTGTGTGTTPATGTGGGGEVVDPLKDILGT